MSCSEQIFNRIQKLFSNRSETIRRFQKTALLIALFVLLYFIGTYLPEGFDWVVFFGKGKYPAFWMPWTKPIVDFLDLPAIFALTVLGISLRTYRYKARPLALALALLSLPTLWVLFLGNVDGLLMIGLLLLPWGAPLVLIKPQVASFALIAKRSSLIITVIWLLLSFVIWGLWPLEWRVFFDEQWMAGWVQDISLFPWGLLLALPLIWFSKGDEDLLMAAGSLGTPHLFPYHFMVLMPALARMPLPWMLLTWFVSFTPLLSNWLGPWAWHFGNLMSVIFWLGIYFGLSPEERMQRKFKISQWRELFRV